MENKFHCLNCGVEFNEAEAGNAGGRCPECGADLTEIAGVEAAGDRKSGPMRLVFAVLVLLVLVILFLVLRTGEKEKSVDEMLAEYRETAAKTPLMIDKSTRLDRVEIEGRSVIFQTTLVNVSGEDADEDLFKRQIGPFLADRYCNDKSSRQAMEKGVTFGHRIFTNDGDLLLR